MPTLIYKQIDKDERHPRIIPITKTVIKSIFLNTFFKAKYFDHKKIHLNNFQSQKFPAKKISRLKIFKKFSRGLKKIQRFFFRGQKIPAEKKFERKKC